MPPSIATILATAIALGASSLVALQAPQRPNLSGQWRLNEAESTDLDSMTPAGTEGRGARGARPGGMPPGGMPPGGMPGGGGRGGRRPGGPGAMSEEQMARMRQTMDLARQAPPRLWIALTDSTVTLWDSAGATPLLLRTDGKKVKQDAQGAGKIEIRARWRDAGLEIERKVDGGGKVTETYSPSYDGARLLVRVRVEGLGRGGAPELRRVYDRVDAPPGS